MAERIAAEVRFCPVQESELGRINELCNIPEIAEHFESIPPVSMEATLALWSYIQSGLVSLWCMHYKDRIIGGAGFYSQPPGTRLSHSAVFFLYIEPAYWGMSIGTKAMKFLEDEVSKRGFIRIECMVADTNPRAVCLYERLGYELEGTKKMAFYLDGKYTDLKIMGKIFWDNLTEEGLHHR
ncbi:MAG TPA: GNAT family N-acetyltransferase [Methanocorpusculum sp.]|jgi:L-phenylalanine/L-methionine N-acetyltransferase|nr:GNAT family N-acetyltransferase [Methanocorpusculum sp.]